MRFMFAVAALASAAVAWIAAANTSNARDLAAADKPEQKSEEKHVIYTNDAGLAVSGYDAVSYFTNGKPVKGSADHVVRWHGAEWRFASAENKAAFVDRPEKFAPAYGGYCAWGVAAKSGLFPADPARWKIEGGRLFLNFNGEVQRAWLEDVEGFIEKGDRVWPELKTSKSAA